MDETGEVGEKRWRAFCESLSAEAKFGVELGLESMRRALAAEGHPERASTAVLVAGTNGKGGTAAYISGLLQAHGRRVGLYTSPHLIDPAERFRVDGRPLARERIVHHAAPILEAYGGEGDPALTYFELTTLIATRLFDAMDVDVAVYEVGLGGRLDAVNAIEPSVSAITCIDTDHTAYLGDNLADIAREKCGIARPGRPLIVGRQTHREVYEVFSECAPDADLELYGRDYDDSELDGLAIEEAPEPDAGLPWTKRTNAATAVRVMR
ncbi:MAG: folylpolyglutamate synthase/dihydrofolate synthase family protein, partial [Bradymonadaceae bacterium]